MMDDTLLITRKLGAVDEIFNSTTGQYEVPAFTSESEVIYNGPGIVWCKGSTMRQNADEYGGQSYICTPYGVMLPLDAPQVEPYDVLTITVASRDASLTSKTLLILNNSIAHTFNVARELQAEERTGQVYPS